ncbi:MAG: hypothetical protein KBD78_14785 [Oligoflexales bacterium]|nr:hypothetical protein [Oligoflexales bacterium]
MLNKKKIFVSFGIIIASITMVNASAFANMSLCEDIAEAKESGSLNLAKELTSSSIESDFKNWDLALIQTTVLLNSGFVAALTAQEAKSSFFAKDSDGVVSYYKFVSADGKDREVVLVRYYVGDTPVGAAFKLFPPALDDLEVEPIIEFIGTISDDELMCLAYLGN